MDALSAGKNIELETDIFRSLLAGRLTDKYKAVELLNNSAGAADFSTLRTLLIKAIKNDFYPGKEVEQDDHGIAQTRSWLLGALGRISADDDAATKLAVRHVDKNHEPYNWARYWALEGLICRPRAAPTSHAGDLRVGFAVSAVLSRGTAIAAGIATSGCGGNGVRL